mgnify:CR=1 FL=1
MEFSTPEYINGKHYYKNSNEVKELLNTTEDYFPISIESLSSIINISIAKFNLDVNFIIKDNNGNNLIYMGVDKEENEDKKDIWYLKSGNYVPYIKDG